jgi:hypothetical protein
MKHKQRKQLSYRQLRDIPLKGFWDYFHCVKDFAFPYFMGMIMMYVIMVGAYRIPHTVISVGFWYIGVEHNVVYKP